MKRALPVLALAALLLLGGCTGAHGPTTTHASNTANGTAAGPTVADLAGPLPGVSASGVSNLSATLDAGDAATTRGFVAVLSGTRTRSGHRTRSRATLRVAAGGRPYVGRTRLRESNETRVFWTNGSVIGITQTRNGKTTHRRPTGPPADARMAPSTTLRPMIAKGTFTVANATGSGADARLVLRATGPNATAAERDGVGNYTGTLELDRRGRLRRANLTYDTGGKPVQVAYRVTRLGNVSVPRPAWFSKARPAVPQVAFDYGARNGTVVVSVQGGDVLEHGVRVRLTDLATNASTTGRVHGRLEAGDSIYVSRTNGTTRFGTTASNGTSTLAGRYRVTVLDPSSGDAIDDGTVTLG